jgi:HEAT repeat protein
MLGNKQPHIIAALFPLLSDPNERVRSGASEALGKLYEQQPAIIDALFPLLSDSSIMVRRSTARALGVIIGKSEDPRVIAALLQTTYDPDRSVQEAASSALANARNDIETIGTRFAEMLKQREQESGQALPIFRALQTIAEKTSSL